MRPYRSLFSAALAVLLAACGNGEPATDGAGTDSSGAALPAPEGAGRSGVTGMPDRPGPGPVGAPPASAPELALGPDGQALAEADPNAPAPPLPGEAGAAPPVDPALAGDPPLAADNAEPTPEDALAVVRNYYAAINARRFDRAYALWSDGGRASGQDPQQFANGFDQTAGVSVELLAPGRVDAGAGQRHIEVPVALTATQRDGSQRKFVGAYVLRRSVVDGASAEQRAWRIGSADLREVKP